jgi:heme exporter protein A
MRAVDDAARTFPPMTSLTARDLACRRGERLVFQRLSFTLEAGGALLLTGPNGSGKSSLLRLLAGLLPPLSGALAWDGEPVARDPAAHRARLQYLGHLDALKPVLTVAETLAFWAGLRGGSAENCQRALERVRLDHLADWPCRHLSAGQKHRLAFARLLASPAVLWLLDEPTTGLDRQAVSDIEDAVAEHRDAGGIVILSTHIPLALEGALPLNMADFAPRRRGRDHVDSYFADVHPEETTEAGPP